MSEDEMSDVEESEHELSKAKLTEHVGRRASIPRSQKSASKNYNVDSSDDEDEVEETVVEENTAAKEIKMEEGVTNGGDVIEDFFNIDGAAAEEGMRHLAGVSPSKKRRIEDNSDAMSDISNFSATFS
jgi:hypothetical protein